MPNVHRAMFGVRARHRTELLASTSGLGFMLASSCDARPMRQVSTRRSLIERNNSKFKVKREVTLEVARRRRGCARSSDCLQSCSPMPGDAAAICLHTLKQI